MKRRSSRRLPVWLSLGLAATALAAAAQPPATSGSPTLQRIRARGEIRVCIWRDYYGVSYRNPHTQQLKGIDIDLSAELARELQVRLNYVESSFAQLIVDVASERCDVAMFAVGVLPERERRLAFTRPYLQSDFYGVTTRTNRMVRTWEDIDKAGVIVAVQTGTVMQAVMAQRLRRAQMLVVRPPASREHELEAGRVDVFMTDYPYSRHLLDRVDGIRLLEPPRPFHLVPYAYATRQGDPVWLARLNEFVSAIKRDGRLMAAASRHGLAAIVMK